MSYSKNVMLRCWICEISHDPEVIKLFILNSAEHEIYSANKYQNANTCWHGILVIINKKNFSTEQEKGLIY